MNKLLRLYLENKARKQQPLNLVNNGTEASLYIYDIISPDWGVSAKDVVTALAQIGNVQTLNVYINSPGGDIFESRAIMAELSRFAGKKVAHIDSLCASAATSIATACDEIVMSDGAFFMIHNASGLAWGDKNALRETADLLEKIEGAIVNDYVQKTGKDAAEIVAMMNAETWFDAKEALEHKFIDRIADDKAAKNVWNLSAYDKAPAALAIESKPPEDPPKTKAVSMAQSNANRLKLSLL